MFASKLLSKPYRDFDAADDVTELLKVVVVDGNACSKSIFVDVWWIDESIGLISGVVETLPSILKFIFLLEREFGGLGDGVEFPGDASELPSL